MVFDQGLLAVLQVDDRKAAVAEMDVDPLVAIREGTLLVRTSVNETPTHLLGCQLAVNLLVGARNAAHGSASSRHCEMTLRSLDQ